MAKVLWEGGFGDVARTGDGDGEILRQAAEKQAERDRAALAYQAAVDQRNLGYGIAAVALLGLAALWGSRAYTANKGHRVPRNRKATIKLHGPRAWAWDTHESAAARKFIKSLRAGAVEGDGGAGNKDFGWDASYEVPMAKSSEVMSKLRRKFAREIASGKLRIKLVREGKWHRGRRVGKGA